MRNMRKSLLSRRELVLLAGTAAYIKADDRDFWNSKPPSLWDLGETYTLTNNSPWARTTRWWGPKTPRHGSIFGKGGGELGGMPMEGPKAVITWESAPPIRDAMRTSPAPVYLDFYVIGVDTIPQGDEHAEHLKDYAHLRCTGRIKWTLRAFGAHNLIRNSSVYLFSFPKASAPIGLDTEVIFDMDIGGWTIQSRFRANDMLYRGRLAL